MPQTKVKRWKKSLCCFEIMRSQAAINQWLMALNSPGQQLSTWAQLAGPAIQTHVYRSNTHCMVRILGHPERCSTHQQGRQANKTCWPASFALEAHSELLIQLISVSIANQLLHPEDFISLSLSSCCAQAWHLLFAAENC